MNHIKNGNTHQINPKNIGINSTAEGMALYRVMESEKKVDERICCDPYAVFFLSETIRGLLHSNSDQLTRYMEVIDAQYPGLSNSVLARTRFFDDVINQMLNDGLDQFVIIGAGYDSRPLRIERLKKIKTIFELDQKEIQCRKRELLSGISEKVPENHVYISIDLEKDNFFESLTKQGFDPSLRSLFLMEGVIYYLSPDSVTSVLSGITQKCGRDCSIIFDYPSRPPQGIMGDHQRSIEKIREHIQNVGEQFKFIIPGDDVNQFLMNHGFTIDQKLSGSELKARYFTGINSNRIVSPLMSVVLAHVTPDAE
nr:class I SAM-dependent methyltransferase [Methanospirillum sp.]